MDTSEVGQNRNCGGARLGLKRMKRFRFRSILRPIQQTEILGEGGVRAWKLFGKILKNFAFKSCSGLAQPRRSFV